MMRVVTPVVIVILVVLAVIEMASAQAPVDGAVALERQSAARALDAVPAVFAIARNLEGIKIDVGPDSIASGFSDLAGQEGAHDQLKGALGAYGFEGYSDWAATIRTIFLAYAYVRARGPDDAAVRQVLQQILADSDVPQSRKDAISSAMAAIEPDATGSVIDVPNQENLSIVVALAPHIESTIDMVRAMQ